jgi:hypothetical protein
MRDIQLADSISCSWEFYHFHNRALCGSVQKRRSALAHEVQPLLLIAHRRSPIETIGRARSKIEDRPFPARTSQILDVGLSRSCRAGNS